LQTQPQIVPPPGVILNAQQQIQEHPADEMMMDVDNNNEHDIVYLNNNNQIINNNPILENHQEVPALLVAPRKTMGQSRADLVQNLEMAANGNLPELPLHEMPSMKIAMDKFVKNIYTHD